MNPQIRLSLFGDFSATLQNGPAPRFRTDKIRALLIYLTIEHDRTHRRDSLATLLWPDVPDKIARKNLRLSFFRMREAIDKLVETPISGSLFESSNQTMQALLAAGDDASPLWLDVARFSFYMRDIEADSDANTLLPASRRHELEEALSLYRGELLPGFHLSEGTPFDEWLLVKREQYREQALMALDLLMDTAQVEGEYAIVRGYAQRALSIEPWRESAYRQLMLACASGGDRGAAMAAYERCKAILWEELGVEPDEQTIEIVDQIVEGEFERVQQPVMVRGPIHNLPASVTRFVGRQAELARLETLFQAEDNRLVTVVGSGGQGKTRLTLAYGEQLVEAGEAEETGRFPHGIFFVPLAPIAHASRLALSIGESLNVQLKQNSQAPTAIESQVQTFLADKQMLLILDNFEHVLDGAEFIANLLRAAPNIQILISSRERLRLYGEQSVSLSGLARAASADGELDEAATLFSERAREVAQRDIEPAELDDVRLICEIVGGMPLALELAAAWLEMMSPAEIADALQQDLDLLESDLRDVPERHRSIRSVFNGSWRMLTERQQMVLSQLSTLRGSFTPEAAAVIAGATPVELRRLRGTSMIDMPVKQRFGMQVLLQQFAGERLAVDPQMEGAVQRRHALYYLEQAAAYGPGLNGPTPHINIEAFEQDVVNIRRGWEFAAHHTTDREIRDHMLAAVQPITDYFVARGLYFDVQQLLAVAVDPLLALADEKGDVPGLLAALFAQLAEAAGREARFDSTLRNVHQALEWARRANRPVPEAQAQLTWCELLWRTGLVDDARVHVEAALTLAEQHNLDHLRGRCHHHLGVIADMANDEAAESYFKLALETWQRLGDRKREAFALNSLGIVALHRSTDQQARQFFEQALALHPEAMDMQLNALVLNNLSTILISDKLYSLARTHLLNSLSLARKIGNRHIEAYAEQNLGRIASEEGDSTEAAERIDTALRLRRQLNDQFGTADVLILRAHHALRLQDGAAALASAQEAKRVLGNDTTALLSLDAEIAILIANAMLVEPEAILPQVEQFLADPRLLSANVQLKVLERLHTQIIAGEKIEFG